MKSKSYNFTVQTQVEKHYIHKDSEFYSIYIDMMKKVTKLYNVCVGIQLFETKVKIAGVRKHKKCYLNADVNAAYQILKKYISSIYSTQQEVLACKYQPIGIKDLRMVV